MQNYDIFKDSQVLVTKPLMFHNEITTFLHKFSLSFIVEFENNFHTKLFDENLPFFLSLIFQIFIAFFPKTFIKFEILHF